MINTNVVVKLGDSDKEWTVYWIYHNSQVELVDCMFRSFNERIVTTNDLTLVRKRVN